MSQQEQSIAKFQTRVRDLLLRFQQLKAENADLYAIVKENEDNIALLKAEIAQKDRDYESLKMARMLEVTNGDLDSAKARVQRLIRDVNKCIAILSDVPKDDAEDEKTNQ